MNRTNIRSSSSNIVARVDVVREPWTDCLSTSKISHAPISYLITVQSHRHMCETIARVLEVPHETPRQFWSTLATQFGSAHIIRLRPRHSSPLLHSGAIGFVGRARIREGPGESEVEDFTNASRGRAASRELGP